MAKHTPGPWRVDNHDVVGGTRALYVVAGNKSICTWLTDRPTPQNNTDARLISTAPELLQIALDIIPEVNDYSDGIHCDECGTPRSEPNQERCDVPGCFYVRIREAIAKATGETP